MASKSTPAATTQPRGISLHIGLNTVSPDAYAGWDGPLAACEFDANDMAAIAKARGLKPTVLLTKKGTITMWKMARLTHTLRWPRLRHRAPRRDGLGCHCQRLVHRCDHLSR